MAFELIADPYVYDEDIGLYFCRYCRGEQTRHKEDCIIRVARQALQQQGKDVG